MKKKQKKPRRKRCNNCNQLFPPDQVTTGPDPYDLEINCETNIVTLCNECYEQSCMEI